MRHLGVAWLRIGERKNTGVALAGSRWLLEYLYILSDQQPCASLLCVVVLLLCVLESLMV